ncbi:unnamed protein product [Chironomus riparius]|uniref:Uncharacterized protein n=1 Tax=Chironomus riparius TaxID=315576 RepID=A0A9N9WRY8_9DIPT|nr:unnamed protein product [Chironomus riparius]
MDCCNIIFKESPCTDVCKGYQNILFVPPSSLFIEPCDNKIFESPMCNGNLITEGASRCEKLFCKDGTKMPCNQSNNCNKCCYIRQETALPCKPCYIVRCQEQSECRKQHKPKSGEPQCGCVYGCPCKAACYDWNPAVRTFTN